MNGFFKEFYMHVHFCLFDIFLFFILLEFLAKDPNDQHPKKSTNLLVSWTKGNIEDFFSVLSSK